MRFVIDASSVLSWCFEDEFDDLARQTYEALAEHPAIVPELWSVEIANALLMAEKKNRVSAERCERFADEIAALPIQVQESPLGYIGRLAVVARRYGLTAYDAAYLELAIREGAALATRDQSLRRAAAAATVALFPA